MLQNMGLRHCNVRKFIPSVLYIIYDTPTVKKIRSTAATVNVC